MDGVKDKIAAKRWDSFMKNSYQWASIFSLTLAVACSASNEPGGVGGTGAVAGDTGTAGFAGDTGVAGYAGDTGVAGDTGTAGVGVGGKQVLVSVAQREQQEQPVPVAQQVLFQTAIYTAQQLAASARPIT